MSSSKEVTESNRILELLRSNSQGLTLTEVMNLTEWGKVKCRNRLFHLESFNLAYHDIVNKRWYAK